MSGASMIGSRNAARLAGIPLSGVPADGEFYRYDATSGLFVPTAPSGVPGAVAALHVSSTQAGNVGAGEDSLASYTLPAGTLASDGDALHIVTIGLVGSGGTKSGYFRTYLGGTGGQDLNSGSAVNSPGGITFQLENRVTRLGASSQRVSTIYHSSSLANYHNTFTAAEDLTTDLDIVATGENVTDATDDVAVFYFWAIYLLKGPA